LDVSLLAILSLALLPAPSARADAADGLITALTNNPPIPAPTPTPTPPPPPPAVTNVPVVTNGVPSLPGPSGAAVRALFLQPGQGKFSVAGRLLALPALEAAPTNLPASPWRRAIDFGMNMTKGNSDTLRYSLGLDVVRERDEDLIRLGAQTLYGKSDDTKDTENASARTRYERQISTRTYGLGYADWLSDTIAGIDYRVTAIASPGWHLLRSPLTILNVEAGAGYLEEKKETDREGYAAGRLAASAERLLNTHVLAWCAVEYIPKFTDTSVFFVNTEAGIASILARNLSLKATLEDRYDHAPAPGIENNDLYVSTALSLNF
jgi:putative salt-induced outer membrane protein YdiY